MAIVYDWYENPNAEGESEERGLHPRPLLNGKVSMEQLYYRVHERSSLSVGDAKSAIDTLTQLCGEELREGREVHIEGLGYFSPTLEATQKVTRKTKNKHLKLRLKGVSFRPDIRLKAALAGVTATQSKYTRHSLRLSEVEIDMRLKEYFTEHELLLRIDFQELCGMARTTANNHLQRLQKEGKLTNVGRRAADLSPHAGILRYVEGCGTQEIKLETLPFKISERKRIVAIRTFVIFVSLCDKATN